MPKSDLIVPISSARKEIQDAQRIENAAQRRWNVVSISKFNREGLNPQALVETATCEDPMWLQAIKQIGYKPEEPGIAMRSCTVIDRKDPTD